MKIHLNKYLIGLSVLLSAFLITSCDEVADEMTVEEPESFTLSELDISEIELDQTNPENPVATFVWTDPDYGQQTVENYDLEFSDTENFENSFVVTSLSGDRDITLSTRELNSAVGEIGLPPSEWNTAYARIISSLGRSQSELPVTSNIISFEVKPYFNYPFNDFFLVGNGTSAGWSNDNNNPPLFRDASNPDLYRYTGFFQKGGGIDNGRFKVISVKGQWQPQWGTTFSEPDDPIENSGGIAGNPTTQDSDPGRFGVESSGYYTFTIDFGNNEYTMEPFNASNATEFTSITLQGSGIPTSTEMNQLSIDPHIWYLNGVSLETGGIQFETNTGNSWGGDTSFSGVATEGGASIDIIVADEYNVWFNDLTGDYIFIPLNF